MVLPIFGNNSVLPFRQCSLDQSKSAEVSLLLKDACITIVLNNVSSEHHCVVSNNTSSDPKKVAFELFY